jgi:glucose-6-phosphate isomerase
MAQASDSTTGALPYSASVAGCLAAAIGAYGLTQAQLDQRLSATAAGLAWLRQSYDDRTLPLLRIVEDTADVAAARAALDRLSAGAETIVFFGTGGSGLGGQTLAQLAGWNIPGHRMPGLTKRPRTRFYDNLDPFTLQQALATLDLKTTRFVITSKSGGTVETLVQAIAMLQAISVAGLAHALPNLVLGLTEPNVVGKANGLRALLAAHKIPMLEHHTGIGGRFSVLSNVGLLPAMARGLDAAALRAGAAEVVHQMLSAKSPQDVPAAVGAALAVGLAEDKSIGCQVMMPYADRLGRFAHWFVQLWAESLGKNGHGTSPIACLGPLDQHSQLQLFQDGPRDHLITILRTPTAGHGPTLDPDLARLAGIEFLAQRHAGDLVAAQTTAVPEALARAGRPVRTFDIPVLDERSMGALLMHFMLETILAGHLLGIDPFDQPAVELAKTLAREHLARQG